MKSSKLNKLMIVTLMALSLSVGKVRAADEFKLWHVTDDGKGSALIHLEDAEDKSKAVKWLGADATQETVKKFVAEHSDEPFMFAEGVKEARAKLEKDGKFDDKAKKSLIEKLEKVSSKVFGSDRAKSALISIAKDILELDKVGEDFLKKLFVDSIKKDLNLTDKKPEVSPSPSPSPTVSPTPAPPKPQPQPVPQPRLGEVDDGELQRKAQQICDKFNGLRDEQLKALTDQINPLKDALNDTFNKLADLSTAANPNNLNNRKNEKGLEDILPGLLQNALAQDKQNDIQPASTSQQPFFPTNNRRDNQDPNAFNQPLPQQDQPQPQQPQMPFMPSTSSASTVPVKLDLPSASGRQELRDAQEALSQAQMRQPIASTLGMNAGLPDLVMAKVKVRTEIQKAQGALMAAKDRAARLDEQLEELKEGGRAALSPSVKREQARLQQDLEAKKAQAEQQKQMMQMLAPEQRDQLMSQVMMQQQQVQAAEQALKQYNAEVEIAIEQGSAQIKSMTKVRDNLQSTATKLESELAGMKEDETAIQQLISTNMQLQMGAGQQTGTPNVNRLQGMGGTGAPRTNVPVRFGAGLQSGAAGGDVRGGLGAQK